MSKQIKLIEVVLVLLVIVVGVWFVMPSVSGHMNHRVSARRAVCGANLRGLSVGMGMYAKDNQGWYPQHYFEATPMDEGDTDHGVRWLGMMGSNGGLRISQPTSPEASPTWNHPSRALFLLIGRGYLIPASFYCPASDDTVDDLRNYGTDADDGRKSPSQPGINRFDFRGYDNLSYSYQLPYGRGVASASLDPQMPIAADKGPYYVAEGPGLAGTKTTRDARSATNPPTTWPTKRLLRGEKIDLRPYNSRHHDGAGQSVLFVDGHVKFSKSPTMGIAGDNIYTIQSNVDAHGRMTGVVPGANQTWGPRSNSDSFLVP